MAKLPICPHCNQPVEKSSPSKKYKTRTYHTNCYNQKMQSMYAEAKTDIEPKTQLYNYICQLFNIEELTPLINAQLQKLFKEQKVTYDGVRLTLYYFFELRNNKPDIEKGIAIVPYVYGDAKKLFANFTKIKEQSQQINYNELYKNETVFVAPKKKKSRNIIDIESL